MHACRGEVQRRGEEWRGEERRGERTHNQQTQRGRILRSVSLSLSVYLLTDRQTDRLKQRQKSTEREGKRGREGKKDET